MSFSSLMVFAEMTFHLPQQIPSVFRSVHAAASCLTRSHFDEHLVLQVIAAKEVGQTAPVRNIDGSTFMYIRHKDMFFVAVTRANSNVGE